MAMEEKVLRLIVVLIFILLGIPIRLIFHIYMHYILVTLVLAFATMCL